MTILLIEGDAFFARIYAKTLEEQGWNVAVASNGDAGIKKASVESPDCILLDLLLPGKHGFEVLEELRADPATASIPLFVLTDLCEPEDIDRCLAAGAAGYAIKAHVRPAEIVERIKKITSS